LKPSLKEEAGTFTELNDQQASLMRVIEFVGGGIVTFSGGADQFHKYCQLMR
jgi:hypothetical protein